MKYYHQEGVEVEFAHYILIYVQIYTINTFLCYYTLFQGTQR